MSSASATEANSEAAADTPTDDVARTAGRGGLALSGAKIYFILLGLVQQIALARVLGMDGFGALRSALSPASITYNPLVTTGIQGMSHAVNLPGQPSLKTPYAVHAALGVIAAIGFWLAAPWLGDFLGAPHIIGALHFLAIVVLAYGFYAPLIGVFNGRRKFLHQAGLDVLAATLRTVGLLVGGYWALKTTAIDSAEGATAGFAVSAVLVLVVAIVLVGRARKSAAPASAKAQLGFVGPVLLGQVLLNLLLQADANTLRRFASDAAQAAGQPLTAADPLVGAYTAAQLFGFLPYQLLIGLTFILFPMLAKAKADEDREAVARYVRTGVRLAMLITGLVVSVSSGLSDGLLRLVFPAEAAELGAASMQLLMLGLACFSIFGALVTVLNSLKYQWASLGATAAAVLFVVVLNIVIVHGTSFGTELLMNTAISTSLGMLLAVVVTAVLVKRAAGTVVSPLTLLRVVVAIGGSIAVARLLPGSGKVLTIVYSGAVAVVYVALLLVLRELRKDDLESIRAVVSRRKGG